MLARAGFFGFTELDDLPPPAQGPFRLARLLEPRGLTHAERGRRISDALNRLGPSYIKLGQFLATRPDIVGSEMADALSALKDDLPPFPTAEARAIVEASIGRPIETRVRQLLRLGRRRLDRAGAQGGAATARGRARWSR